MNILTLIIKQKYFDEIINGTKRVETREIRAKTAHKYICYVDSKGKIYKRDIDIPDGVKTEVEPVKYDAIKLYVGYNKDRASALVGVKSADIVISLDENNNEIEYEYEGRVYLAAEIDYHLGSIIEKSV